AVSLACGEHHLSDGKRLYLPTGDGLCIVLLGITDPYDIHLRLALDILARLKAYRNAESDSMRQFEVRIGINSNIDNSVTDINGNKNVAGAGINMAQRIMSLADGSQILVSRNIFEILSQRERYREAFKMYTTSVKHGVSI